MLALKKTNEMLTLEKQKIDFQFDKKSPKSKLKAGWGAMKGKISETNDCWNEDLKKTISE
jgi:hypothetical protein